MGAILGAMLFVRMGMEPLVKSLRSLFKAKEPWERSTEFHILREVNLPSGGAAVRPLPPGQAARVPACTEERRPADRLVQSLPVRCCRMGPCLGRGRSQA